MEKNKIYHQDCIEGMKRIGDNTVDIIIADPPYNIGKNFGAKNDKQNMKHYLNWCKKWIQQCLRILKPDGTMYIYGFSEILAYIHTMILDPFHIHEQSENEQSDPVHVRWIAWHYTNKTVPSLHFWQRSHESILVCYKESKIFNRDSIREEYTQSFLNNSAGKVRPATKGRFGEKATVYHAHEKGALPRDIIKIPTLAGGSGKKERVDHPTQKPLALCLKLLLACQREKERNLVVVPFAGSGSECVAAKQLDMDFISFELNEDYITIANKRMSKVSPSEAEIHTGETDKILNQQQTLLTQLSSVSLTE